MALLAVTVAVNKHLGLDLAGKARQYFLHLGVSLR